MTDAERDAVCAGYRLGVLHAAQADEPLCHFAIRAVTHIELRGVLEIETEETRAMLGDVGDAVRRLHLEGGDEIAATLHELELTL